MLREAVDFLKWKIFYRNKKKFIFMTEMENIFF